MPYLPISKKISRVYLLGAATLLICYALMFKATILVTENKNSMHRLVITAPHHFNHYEQGKTGTIVIDPLLTIYDNFEHLPLQIQRRITTNWTGIQSYHFEDESEFAVFGKQISSPKGKINVFAVENIDAIEWSDGMFILLEGAVFITGLILFIISAGFINKLARRISSPFVQLATQLQQECITDFSELKVTGTSSKELEQIRNAINEYRIKISQSIAREQAFTRYVSHELRTPMTVIKGTLSILKRQKLPAVEKQSSRIKTAVDEMEQLTNTFLLLARNDELAAEAFLIDEDYIINQVAELNHLLEANQTQFSLQLQHNVKIQAHSTLFNAVLKNLLINAINCTYQGTVSLFIDTNQLNVIDTGIGLDNKPRGYEGFGIGLTIVKDICNKYGWQFSLENNETQGCIASVKFN
ncbi:HAMP domain-containing histidine kinase [Pseudoalteromonas sp. C2R02]|uniref:sensor histidine kinase n=1 Tax=Pseudoalteromonas sp. C2R02 TaxID=2841565 RepID=UPI001C09975F|nr:HAMP domain-containing sensor histidine kinase [Pseudoalteromonas sp. C2R02]MBU2972457.1 HAMP domain-containing histidine kinase [Pseudoalteromonas sp. C2R02]